MKKLIRLTESDIRSMIKESVNRILSERKAIVAERIKGEKGMSDDEVMRRRNRNFEKDMDSLHKDPYSPNYSDRVEMNGWYKTPQEMELDVAKDRKNRHYRTQRHKTVEEGIGDGQYHGVNDEWYAEEDYNGNTGEEGMIRSYDIGAYYDSNAEADAKESGYDNIEDYLRYYFDEIKSDCPWYWQRIGKGYGYHGNTIFREGGLVCKEIFGQIMFDEYPIGQAEYDEDFNNRLNKGEYYAK